MPGTVRTPQAGAWGTTYKQQQPQAGTWGATCKQQQWVLQLVAPFIAVPRGFIPPVNTLIAQHQAVDVVARVEDCQAGAQL